MGSMPSGSAPTGLIAFDIYGRAQKTPFASPTFGDSFISGVDLATQWCNIEPKPGVYNWAPLTQVFDEAAPSEQDPDGKFVVLALIPGFDSPAWALKNVPSVTSSFSYGGPGATETLPMPWSELYLHRWYRFLQVVADRYGSNPEFRAIQTAGPTSVSTEMTLPDWTGTSPNKTDTGLPAVYKGNDLTMWNEYGYSPGKLIHAWRQTLAVYHKIFPLQYMALSLHQGLPIAGARGCNAECETANIPLQVIADGVHNYSSSFILQENGLGGVTGSTGSTDPDYNVVKANCGKVDTGLQTKVPQKEGSLSQALVSGRNADVAFLEVYESDVVNNANTIKSFDVPGTLPSTVGCVPLTLSAHHEAVELDGPTTVQANTTLNLPSDGTQVINIYEHTAQSGVVLVASCDASSCPVIVPSGHVPTRFTADVGLPGAHAYTTQALASTSLIVDTKGTKPAKVPIPPFKRPGCTANNCN